MIRINPVTAPAWVEAAPGLRFLIEPIGTVILTEALTDPRVADLPADMHPDVRFVHVVNAVARLAIRDWEGVTLGDDDSPAPVTPENIAAVMEVRAIHRVIAEAVAKALLIGAEKKG